MEFVGIRNKYAESGEAQSLFQKYGLMPEDIAAAARKVLKRKLAGII
jgi:transketolase C-terminal domain/subunit